MDRRHFVAGSAAAAAARLRLRPAFAQDAYPSHAITFINPFPPGGAADVVGRPLAAMLEPHSQAALHHRNQSGRRRPGRWPGRCDRKARRLHAADPYRLDFRLCRSRQAVRPPAQIHARRFHSDRAADIRARWCCWSTTSSPTRRVKELVDDAKKNPDKLIFSSSGLYGALHLPTALFMKAAGHQDEASADQRRRSGAHGDPRQQFAGVGVVDRGGERTDQGRQAARARVLQPDACSLAARRADLERARLQCRVFAVGRRVCAERHAGTCAAKRLATRSSKAANSDQFKTAINNIGDEVAYLDQAGFAKFWDEDAKRVEAAVQAIGRVQG